MTAEVLLLLVVALVAGAVLIVDRRWPRVRRFEQTFPWLLPEDFVRAMETIAASYPVRYAVLIFLSWLGICSVAAQVGVAYGPIVQFGVGTVVAVIGTGLQQKLRIQFERAGVKTVMVRYANLELG